MIENNLILDLLPFKLQSNTLTNELNSFQPLPINRNKNYQLKIQI